MDDTPSSLTRVATRGEVERVYREEGARLWRAVSLYAGDPDIASDAVAEAFAQVLGRAGAVRSVDRWVWRVAFRVAAGLLQERRRTVPHLHERMDRRAHEIAGPSADLLAAVRSLSPRQRAAIALHYYADYPVRKVAALLGSTPAAVGVHLYRARRRLRKLLGEAHD